MPNAKISNVERANRLRKVLVHFGVNDDGLLIANMFTSHNVNVSGQNISKRDFNPNKFFVETAKLVGLGELIKEGLNAIAPHLDKKYQHRYTLRELMWIALFTDEQLPFER